MRGFAKLLPSCILQAAPLAATHMPTSRHRTIRTFLPGLGVFLIAGSLYVPGLPGAFIFDSIPTIVKNEGIHMSTLNLDSLLKVVTSYQFSGDFRILPTLSFALNYWLANGADPASFKITNILIHALTACSLAYLFRNILLAAGKPEITARWQGPALALLWAAHPLQVSSVLYVVQRIQTMGTLFLVLALLAYTVARQRQISGHSGRRGLLSAFLFWTLALGCKEDSLMLPAYTLALELTVLRFAATDRALSLRLKHVYLAATIVGAALFFLVAIPHFWQWQSYRWRDFNTYERLLTQGRVLCMYLWQIILPLPSHMPFYYDGLQPSRGLLQPWTTLPSMCILFGLFAAACRLRTRKPVFALGVYFFFAAHFITSNIVGLELAFEHRNNFALIGAALIAGSILSLIYQKLDASNKTQVIVYALIVTVLGSGTILRASQWSNKLSFASTSVVIAPNSARAWILLCATYFEEGGGATKTNPYLSQAIATCSRGANSAPYALNSLALLLVMKTVRGDDTTATWARFQHRIQTVFMSRDNSRAPSILTYHFLNGVDLDRGQLLNAMSTLAQRAPLNPMELASIGNFVMSDLKEPDLSIPYYIKAIEGLPENSTLPEQIAYELRAKSRQDLADRIEQLAQERRRMAQHPFEYTRNLND